MTGAGENSSATSPDGPTSAKRSKVDEIGERPRGTSLSSWPHESLRRAVESAYANDIRILVLLDRGSETPDGAFAKHEVCYVDEIEYVKRPENTKLVLYGRSAADIIQQGLSGGRDLGDTHSFGYSRPTASGNDSEENVFVQVEGQCAGEVTVQTSGPWGLGPLSHESLQDGDPDQETTLSGRPNYRVYNGSLVIREGEVVVGESTTNGILREIEAAVSRVPGTYSASEVLQRSEQMMSSSRWTRERAPTSASHHSS